MGNKELKIKDRSETYDKNLNLVLDILLRDNTTGTNIIWATDNYEKDYGHKSTDIIKIEDITGDYEGLIKPRLLKSKTEQQRRTKEKAEVFTPAWVCCIQNNYPDEQRFGEDVFAKVDYKNKTWKTIDKPIPFPIKDGGNWQDYIKANVLEACCGEAPYIVSPFDVVSGKEIELKDRIGLLDRKFRVLNEARKNWHKSTEEEKEVWIKWAKEALKHTYGYEWSGDNLLLARENIFQTVIEYYQDQFNENPDKNFLKDIAEIISWNLWQMDGLKFVVPMSCYDEPKKSQSMSKGLFAFHNKMKDVIKEEEAKKGEINCPGCKNPDFIQAIKQTYNRNKKINNPDKAKLSSHNGIFCKIMNWDTGNSQYFGRVLMTPEELGFKE